MPFWSGLRSGKGSPPAGAACGALASALAPRRVPAVALSGPGRLRCRRLSPFLPGDKTHAPQGIRVHGQ